MDPARDISLSTEFQLRGYRPSDLDAMYALDMICFEPQFRFSRSHMRKFAEAPNARVVVAERDGKLAGFCIVHLESVNGGTVGYIVTLDVEPALRQQGLGQRLMQVAEQQTLAAGVGGMALHVFTGNESAVRFYECLGYRRLDRARNFYGARTDAWVYVKGLQNGGPGPAE